MKIYDSSVPGYQFAINGLANLFVYKMLQNLNYRHLTQTELSSNLKNLEFLSAINTYIEENYGKKFSLDEISKHIGYNKCYFSRFFKAITNTTFNHYLTEYRVNRSVDLLCNTGFTMEMISGKCGFENTRNFQRAFLKIKGSTPSAFRHSYGNAWP